MVGVQFAVVSGVMITLWLVSLRTRNVAIVDSFWGLGFVLVAWTTLLGFSDAGPRPWLITIVISCWGIRLALYLHGRNHGKPEDHRYAAMRQNYGPSFAWRSLYIVFGLQAVLLVLISLPVQFGQLGSAPLNLLDAIGAGVWLFGWLWESLADWQLASFKADPKNKGQVLDQGLWRLSRHPNYFGEAVAWWGVYLIAFASGQATWTIFSPILLTFLLLRISGVTLLEKSLKETKPAYADYIRRTSPFIPWKKR